MVKTEDDTKEENENGKENENPNQTQQNQGATFVCAIDSSSSMQDHRSESLKAFQKMFEQIKEAPELGPGDRCFIYTFTCESRLLLKDPESKYLKLVYGGRLRDAELTADNFKPDGNTPILTTLATLLDSSHPLLGLYHNIHFLFLTDGEENMSAREHSIEVVAALVKTAQENRFISIEFIAPRRSHMVLNDQPSVRFATKLGIPEANVTLFDVEDSSSLSSAIICSSSTTKQWLSSSSSSSSSSSKPKKKWVALLVVCHFPPHPCQLPLLQIPTPLRLVPPVLVSLAPL